MHALTSTESCKRGPRWQLSWSLHWIYRRAVKSYWFMFNGWKAIIFISTIIWPNNLCSILQRYIFFTKKLITNCSWPMHLWHGSENSYLVNSLWSSDNSWWHRSVSTLAKVMACCLMAPSHYLNQSWLLINEVLWHSPGSNFEKWAPSQLFCRMNFKFILL